MQIKCEQCSATAVSEDGETPREWFFLGSAYAGMREEITVSGYPPGRYSIKTSIPRALYFCSKRHAAEWLTTAIENHIHCCEQEDAETAKLTGS
jgi:hypothetical protein